VSESVSSGKDFKVRVSCVGESTVYGQSGAFEISAGYGKIKVTSTPPGAKILLDGVNTGKMTPQTLPNISAGTHIVKVEKSGYDPEEQTVTVAAGQTVNVTFTLEGYGSIKVTSTPGSAKVYLDGASTGKMTTCILTRVVKGLHIVKVEKAGYEAQERTVTVDAGRTANVNFTLKGIGKIRVTSTPTGAGIYLDGVDTGQQTACTLEDVPVGSHTVRAEKDGYETQKKTVTVSAGATADVNFILAKTTITIDKPDLWSIWGKGKDVEIKWSMGSSAAGWNGLRTERELRGLAPSLRNPLRGGEAGRSVASLRRAGERTGLGTAGTRPGVMVEAAVKGAGADAQPVPPAIANVKIELYKGEAAAKIIADSTNNDGLFTWTVDELLEDGVDYRVVISDTGGSGASGESQEFALTDVTYEYQGHWGAVGTANGQFQYPSSICVDRYSNVYVADSGNNRIQKFSSWGVYLGQWGTYGTLDGQFKYPVGIAADANQVIFVTDFYNNRVQSFDSSGNFK